MSNFLTEFGTYVVSEASAPCYTNYWPVDRFASLVMWKDKTSDGKREKDHDTFPFLYPANTHNIYKEMNKQSEANLPVEALQSKHSET